MGVRGGDGLKELLRDTFQWLLWFLPYALGFASASFLCGGTTEAIPVLVFLAWIEVAETRKELKDARSTARR